MEGCGSVHLTNGSRSGRPKNVRIRNTASICLGTFSLCMMCEYAVSRLDNTEHKQVVDHRNTFTWAAEFVYRGTWSLMTEGIRAFAKTSLCVSLLLNSVHIYLKIPDKSYSMKYHLNWVTAARCTEWYQHDRWVNERGRKSEKPAGKWILNTTIDIFQFSDMQQKQIKEMQYMLSLVKFVMMGHRT
jgi:hypothetical protein